VFGFVQYIFTSHNSVIRGNQEGQQAIVPSYLGAFFLSNIVHFYMSVNCSYINDTVV